ncbi:hypothetical protein HDG35_004372 [Paraburkholderia sp. JPY681]|nr:hypothetical protein [Paraburkholderia atlantica]
MGPEMPDDVYQALRAAVNLARFEQIRSVPALKSRLQQMGHSDEAARQAIKTWADYERSKRC